MFASRCGTASRCSLMPSPPLSPISTAEQVRPAAPMSWIEITAPVAISSRQASIRRFSVNGSPTCTVGRLSSIARRTRPRPWWRRRRRRARSWRRDRPPACRRPTRPNRRSVGVHEPGGKGIDEAVAVIGGIEPHLAADAWHAETVAIAADPLDHAMHQLTGPRVVRAAEAERVHRRDRARAHGEDVAQDAAHAGRGALP